MHFALLPCLVCAAVGAVGGWIWRDRDFYKAKDEESGEGGTASGATKE